jgi:hypothetical protein
MPKSAAARTSRHLLAARLANQHLTAPVRWTPAAVVSWFGAMQAQDFAGAKWAIGLRAPGLLDRDLDTAVDVGAILRTHVLRPTWHFVAPADIRWMLALTGPRVQAFNAPYYRKFGLGREVLARRRRAIERALTRAASLTRDDLRRALESATLRLDGLTFGLILMHAELEGVICSGPRRGKHSTYALLDRRAPGHVPRDRDDALGELTRRYFTSHGPATLRDFAWWSGLTQRDGRRGVEIAGPALSSDTVDGLTYWSAPHDRQAARRSASSHLLPNYDECLIAYQDRTLSAPLASGPRHPRDPFAHHVLVDGRVAGSWSRTISTREIAVDVACYSPPDRGVMRGIERAAARYGAFLERPVRVRFAGRR